MNRTVFCVLSFVFAAALLSGCAAQSPALVRHSGSDLYDADYMRAVEHKAAQRGVKVRWIAPPMKPVAIAENDIGDHQ